VSRWAVILAGGVGSRFWPLSTRQRPKQLLPLIDDAPLVVNTLRRLAPLVPAARTLILTNASLTGAVGALLPDVPARNIIGEPRAANTGPALTWAAAEIARRDGPDSTMICVHADWAIGDPDGFRNTLACAAEIAEREHALVTVGIVPTRPDTGFGYIEPGDALGGARRVARFTEKPKRGDAETMVRQGQLWNSGIFVWRVGDFLSEVRALAVEIAPALPLAERGDLNGFFAAVQSIAVDHAVIERSRRVLVVPGEFGWDDVGTWAALHRVRQHDSNGNATAGDTIAREAGNNVVHVEGSTVVLYGVDDLVVVVRPGLTLITTRDRAADLKTLLDSLPAEVRDRP